jgi:hypothetical protein
MIRRFFVWLDEQPWFWDYLIAYGAVFGMIAITAYYTYYAGWQGFFICIGFGALSLLIMSSDMAYLIPGVGTCLRYWDRKNKEKKVQ